MKYMGSKRVMLLNGLGTLIDQRAPAAGRFVDLFCGSGSVSWFAAQKTNLPVLANDLQMFSSVLAGAVVSRDHALDAERLIRRWLRPAMEASMQDPLWDDADAIDKLRCNSRTWVSKARGLCKEPSRIGPIWSAYGGYYFSPRQALLFDYMLSLLPKRSGDQDACLAATIVAASECAASPGHTAQPFRPTTKAAPFIRESWGRNPAIHAEKALRDICGRFATVAGDTNVGDAIDLVNELSEKDLVFVDPPYSGVHYSRFYHVLETVARGHCGEVTGAGRYPPSEERPASGFSRKSEAKTALNLLLERLASRGCTVILTFPENDCSNGLSGSYITSAAGQYFRVKTRTFTGQFSTLGGNNVHRMARQRTCELILLLMPR